MKLKPYLELNLNRLELLVVGVTLFSQDNLTITLQNCSTGLYYVVGASARIGARKVVGRCQESVQKVCRVYPKASGTQTDQKKIQKLTYFGAQNFHHLGPKIS